MIRNRHLAALLGLAALAAPAAASADDRDHRAGRDKAEDGVHHVAEPGDDGHRRGRGRDRKPVKSDTYVFKGIYAGGSQVTITGGNSRVRRNGFVGRVVAFDFATARVAVADVDGNGAADLTDVQAGDRVVVQARLPRSLKAPQVEAPLAARKLVDKTHPRSSDDDDHADDRSGS